MTHRSLLLLGAAFALAPGAYAVADEGEQLHRQHCAACHDRLTGGDGTTLYTRTDRRVTSLAALGRQVRLCKDNLAIRLFDEEVDAIVRYLNGTYYRFEE